MEGGGHLSGSVLAVPAIVPPWPTRTLRTGRAVLPIAAGIALFALLALFATLSPLAPLASPMNSAPVHASTHAHAGIVGLVVIVVVAPPPAHRIVDVGLRKGPDMGQGHSPFAGDSLHQSLQGRPSHLQLGIGLHLLLHIQQGLIRRTVPEGGGLQGR